MRDRPLLFRREQAFRRQALLQCLEFPL